MTAAEAAARGFWVLDDHLAGPPGALLASLVMAPRSDGFAAGFARYGAPVATLDGAIIDGWAYLGPRPLTDPAEWARRAGWVEATDVLAVAEAEARRGVEHQIPTAHARRRALGDDLDGLDDAGLAERITSIAGATRDLVRERFATNPTGVLYAEYMLAAGEVAGWDPATAATALGPVPASAALVGEVRAVAGQVASVPALAGRLRAGDGVTLDDLRSEPAVAGAVDDLLDRCGDELLAPSITAPTVAERPDLLVGLVGTHLRRDGRGTEPPAGAHPRQPGMAPAQGRPDPCPMPPELAGAAARAHLSQTWREFSSTLLFSYVGLNRRAALAAGRRLAERQRLDEPGRAVDLEPEELAAALVGGADVADRARGRFGDRQRAALADPPPVLGAPPPGPPGPPSPEPSPTVGRHHARLGWLLERMAAPAGPPSTAVEGVAASAGRCRGPVRLVTDPEDFTRVGDGDVVVCEMTAPAWNAALALAGAVVCDVGGFAGHAALMARELGIPAVVGTRNATRALADGELVTVDGGTGTVTRVGQ